MSELKAKLDLLSRTPGIEQAVILGRDGLLVEATGAPDRDPDMLAALAPAALSSLTALGDAAGIGPARTVVAECGDGIAIVRDVTEDVILAVVAAAATDLARALFEIRRTGEELRPLVA